jgi:hypothetical protein
VLLGIFHRGSVLAPIADSAGHFVHQERLPILLGLQIGRLSPLGGVKP